MTRTRSVHSGSPTTYDADNITALHGAIAHAWTTYLADHDEQEPSRLSVRADVEWSGVSRGVRAINFGDIPMDGIRGALNVAENAQAEAGTPYEQGAIPDASRQVADALSDALRRVHGAEIRIFDIERFQFS